MEQCKIIRVDSFTFPSLVGVGKYWGRVQTMVKPIPADPFAALDMSEHFKDEDAADVLILHPNDITAGGHMLDANTYVMGVELLPTDNGDRVFLVNGISPCG